MTALNRSRSTNSTLVGSVPVAREASTRLKILRNSARLGRPVTGSWCASRTASTVRASVSARLTCWAKAASWSRSSACWSVLPARWATRLPAISPVTRTGAAITVPVSSGRISTVPPAIAARAADSCSGSWSRLPQVDATLSRRSGPPSASSSATEAPSSSSAAPPVTASRISGSGRRAEIARWMVSSDSTSRCRVCAEVACRSFSARRCRSAASTRMLRSASPSTWAMPCSICRSSGRNGSSSRATTSASAFSPPSGLGAALSSPRPGTSSRVWPAAEASSAASGTASPKPYAPSTRPSRTTAPTSASTISAARSTALAMATSSSSAALTAVKNSVSRCVDQVSMDQAKARVTRVRWCMPLAPRTRAISPTV